MRRLIWPALLVLVTIACGSPTAPTDTPIDTNPSVLAANLLESGTAHRDNCNDTGTDLRCDVEGVVLNKGQGCAADVTTVLRLYDAADVLISTRTQAMPGIMIRPGTAFAWRVGQVTNYTKYRVSFTWLDVGCG